MGEGWGGGGNDAVYGNSQRSLRQSPKPVNPIDSNDVEQIHAVVGSPKAIPTNPGPI